jgi:hypothetical protein
MVVPRFQVHQKNKVPWFRQLSDFTGGFILEQRDFEEAVYEAKIKDQRSLSKAFETTPRGLTMKGRNGTDIATPV